jgi:hypothetical protein
LRKLQAPSRQRSTAVWLKSRKSAKVGSRNFLEVNLSNVLLPLPTYQEWGYNISWFLLVHSFTIKCCSRQACFKSTLHFNAVIWTLTDTLSRNLEGCYVAKQNYCAMPSMLNGAIMFQIISYTLASSVSAIDNWRSNWSLHKKWPTDQRATFMGSYQGRQVQVCKGSL